LAETNGLLDIFILPSVRETRAERRAQILKIYMALWMFMPLQPKGFTMQINGLVKILADIQFVISGLEREGKVVQRGVTIWMPRWAQRQCLAIEADSSGDVIYDTAFFETGDEDAP
jgi:hypothetical protein